MKSYNSDFLSPKGAAGSKGQYTVFDVFVVTEQYIYQAELSYLTTLMSQYSMYNTYLENSFVVNELSQG